MKYFTKYLPVKGLPKEGDYIRETKTGIETIKLFLCSRDIQVGDKVGRVYHDELGWGTDHTFYNGSGNLHATFDNTNYDESAYNFSNVLISKGKIVKVIGEVSPEATWVKEGMEFEEEDIEFRLLVDQGLDSWYEVVDLNGYITETPQEESDKDYVCHKQIRIKGPCGHFH